MSTMARIPFLLAMVLCAVLAAALLASCSPLALVNAGVPSDTYYAANDIAYGPDARQRLDVYRPAHAVSPAPVVVFFYGGNWNSGDRKDYLFVGEALAAKGFVAVVPDYRLYPQVRFPGFLADSAHAVRWIMDHIAEYGGDPQRVFVMGHSAGAYNAAMLALNPEYLKAAGVDPKRIRGMIGLAGPYDFLPLTGRVTREVFGYPDTPVTTQPIHFASSASPPVLVITGAEDDVVDPGNSVRLGASLKEHGVFVREIVYPKLGHRSLIGALAAPLRSHYGPVLEDVSAFVNELSASR
jgi:acetyl esterase/lipase